MGIGESIKRIRTLKKMTQKELGEKLGGIPQQQIGRWESGSSTPKIETIQKIATALEISINDLLEQEFCDSPAYRAMQKKNSPLLLDYKNRRLTEEIDCWEPIDIELVKKFKTLNESGQTKAIERVEELTEIPRYTQKETDMPDKGN